jgi:hypothetical protein
VFVYLEIQRRAKHAAHLIRAGFPSLWAVAGVIAFIVGGSLLLAFTWGIRHLNWGLVIILAVIILLLIEGSYRESRKTDRVSRSPRLLPLRELVAEGQAIQARLPASDKRGLMSLPSDLLRDFEAWKIKATAALEPWPTCRAQFRGNIVYPALITFEPARRCSEIEQRTKVFGQIVQSLAQQDLG